MTGIEALNKLIGDGVNDNTDIGPGNCTCNNCRTCWYSIIHKEIKEPDISTGQMQIALMIQSLDMQKFLSQHTQSMVATFGSFVCSFLDSITEENKKRLIQLSIEKLELDAIEYKDKILKKFD